MSEQKTIQDAVKALRKGLNQGFSASYVMHKLERHGFRRSQLDHALKIITNPNETPVEEPKEPPKKEKKEEPIVRKEPSYDEIIRPRKDIYEKKKQNFQTFKDPHSLVLIVVLCVLFFILGIIIDRLILLI